MKRALALLCFVSCAGANGVGMAPSTASKEPTSDPAEYHDRGLSAAMGREYFERIGLGDPYRTGIAYPIYLALLRAYPDLFGKNIDEVREKFGFVRRDPGEDLDAREGLPMGMHLTIDPNTKVPFLVGSCALCHSERLQFPDGTSHLVLGLGNKRIRIHAYDAAFTEVVNRPGFDDLLPLATEEARNHHVVWPDDYRRAITNATFKGMRDRARIHAESVRIAQLALPGRVATIESFAMVLGVPISKSPGFAKIPDVIGFPWRETLSWDGAGTGAPTALVVEADLANGMRPEWLETHRHIGTSLYAYLKHQDRDLKFPGSIDASLAAHGQEIFEAHCSQCHGTYANGVAYREKVIPIDVIKTDKARMLALTDAFAAAANAVPAGRGLTHAARSNGYVPPVLLDVFARAPYGHVGQWPSLAVMAMKERPKRFIVDPTSLDLQQVGVKWRMDGNPGTNEYVYDANTPGHDVAGHPFLADLASADAAAVIEYLKTL